ncbi:rab-GTPase-TBC domain-containing protein [Radiomyces spectabilis]|uniref:rab-GTPase-TBC domain-containing protein n=1 Tax=Radiomyces spectabilis TaxID=64574 RepID=UPI002220AB0F|nr:rab-GTPase-TBC domain-containing protein [Radiomyces spectabilis]KAI8365972.1 rab-GTPase-TBC domain-containing protein [Radiomyces spectabilis]
MIQLSSHSTALGRAQSQKDEISRTMSDQDELLSNLNDFNEILQSEVYVDLDRLRILARHGIPDQLRGEVWKYLLGVQEADRSKELSRSKARSEEYEQIDKVDPEVAKRIRSEVTRYQRRVRQLEGKVYAAAFENVILAYLNTNRDVEYNPALISLCAPFIYVLDKECDAFFCFERMMQAIEEFYTTNTIKERVANFMTLFRYVLPELCSYFEDEEVDLNEWVTSWLQNLLAKEMRFDDLLRLWDSYFAMMDPLNFHPFVCLSILRNAKENLEDLEQSEIRTVLLRLPNLNMRMVITEAYNLRHETLERQMSEDGDL